MILRNLIVAGANLNERGPRQQTALHMAAEREEGGILTNILLDAGADWALLDDNGNSALHTAARLCHVSVAEVLSLNLTSMQNHSTCVVRILFTWQLVAVERQLLVSWLYFSNVCHNIPLTLPISMAIRLCCWPI